MFPQIPPIISHSPDSSATADNGADELYRSALKMVGSRSARPRSPAQPGDLLVRWKRASRRHFWRLDRWRLALDRFREAARLGGVVCSARDESDATARQSDQAAFIWLIRVSELFARRLAAARRFDWAVELHMDALRATADLRRDADWPQMQIAIESEMHLMRELRATLSSRRIRPELLARAVEKGKHVFAQPMNRRPLLQREYARRTESRYLSDEQTIAPPREQLRRAIYHCLIDAREGSMSSSDLFQVVDREVTMRFPEDFCDRHDIASDRHDIASDRHDIASDRHDIASDQPWSDLIDDALKTEFVELYQMSLRMDARDAAAGATLSFLCVAAYHRRLGFYPANLGNACVEFETDVPIDPFADGRKPLQLRLAGGEKLRGTGVDNLRQKIRTQVSQPLVYSTGPDREDDKGAIVWNGMSSGVGDWIFPLPAHRRPRHWRQFDLRKTLIAMTLLGLFFAYFNSPAARQSRAVSWIETTGGDVEYSDYETLGWRGTMANWIGHGRYGTPYYASIGSLAPTSEVLEKIQVLRELTTINLDSCRLEPGDLARLQKLPKLESVYLDGAEVSATEFQHLAGLVRLRELRCGGTCMNDARFTHLPKLPGLQSLTLSHSELTGATFQGMSDKFPNLTELVLYGSNCTDAGLAEIGKLKRLTYLDLDGTKITNEGIARLSGLRNLETLDVQSTRLSDAALRHLTKMTKLKELRLNETKIDGSGLVHLLKLPNLVDLSLNSTFITDKDVPTLAKLTSLNSLSIEGTRITPNGSAAFKALASTSISFPDWPAVWMTNSQDPAALRTIETDYSVTPPIDSPP